MKKNVTKGLTAAFLVAAAAHQASAQTVFDGAYYGVGVGYGKAETSETTGGFIMPDSKGAFASGIIGWNGSSGNFVFGVEADASFGAVNGSGLCGNPTWTCDADMKALGSLRARVGAVSGNTLFFATGGVAAARMKLMTDNNLGATYPDTQTVNGWVVGVGAEQEMPSGWNLRGEILYYEFNKKDYDLDITYPDMETKMTGVRVSMTHRF